MDSAYGEHYRELYQKHWWWRARTQFIAATLDHYRPVEGWGSILDVGCGDGLFFDHLSRLGDVEGIEPSADLVDEKGRFRDRINICPFDDSFQPGRQYSLILMLDVLEHLQDPAAALTHVRNLLARDGRFVATVPAFMNLWTNHDVLNHHFTRYTKARLVWLIAQSGLRVEDVRYFYHWTYPLKLAVALFENIVQPNPQPAKVPWSWLNQMFYAVSRVEQKTITQLSLPFGSSLLLVARR